MKTPRERAEEIADGIDDLLDRLCGSDRHEIANRVEFAIRVAMHDERIACMNDLAETAKLDYPTGGAVENVVCMVFKSALDRIRARGEREP